MANDPRSHSHPDSEKPTRPMNANNTGNTTKAIGTPASLTRLTDGVRALLAPLASLKLTVFLLVLATLVTLIGTLEQTRQDIDAVKHRYFLENRVFLEVPVQTFFVPAWFPEWQNVPGYFWIPSGMTLLVMMMVNLSAAHLLRFRLAASGGKLIVGWIVAAIACAVTWAIIFNSQSPSGLQGEPPIPWEKMWVVLQIVVLGIACAAGFGFISVDRQRVVERVLLAIAVAVFGGLLVVTMVLGRDAFIGDSAMRIVWQLTQSTIAAAISLVACVLLFNRKAGMVLLHLGIVGLMANELYVNATNEEQRMTIFEGDTVSEAVDIRTTELAIVDVSDPEFDEIVVVPEQKLMSGSTIRDDQLPFDVTGIEFFSNSDISSAGDPAKNLATHGLGKRFTAVELPVSAGTSMEQKVDFASAYVELTDRTTSQSLGTYLVSQMIGAPKSDTVVVDGTPYRIMLRFKTEYKPISITLVDVTAEYYPGTETPRKFASKVNVKDSTNGSEMEHEIWMNNPLRYAGETFYQSGYDKLSGGVEYTVLQVVKNRGWMIPYVCCMFTVMGLVVQFGNTLLGYLKKQQQTTAKNEMSSARPGADAAQSPAGGRSVGKWVAWAGGVPAIVIVGFLGLYVAGEAYKAQTKTVAKDGFRLDLLGQIPVTHNGRVQPLDSFARHTVLQMNKRETVFNRNDKAQPAIRWLADTLFHTDGYDEYRLFRIEDPEVISALGLPYPMPTPQRHKKCNLRYTLKELLGVRSKFQDLLPLPKDVKAEDWNVFQKRVGGVATKMQQALAAERVLGYPVEEDDNLIRRLEQAERDTGSRSIPLVVPTEDPRDPWLSFVRLQNQAWLAGLAQKYQCQTVKTLAAALIDQDVMPGLKAEIVKSKSIQRLMESPKMLELFKEQLGETDPDKLARMIAASWDDFPPDIRKGIETVEGPLVDALITDRRSDYLEMMSKKISQINGGEGPIKTAGSKWGALLLKLRPAYQAGESEVFNQTLVDYLAAINAEPPAEMSTLAVATEGWYNRFAPFYLAMVIYIVAMVVAIVAWILWTDGLNRAAFGLLTLALSLQVIGLVMRVVISGRPPVTNLYSSFLFVSAVFVLGMLVLERVAKLGVGYVLAGLGGFLALMAAWNMSIVDGDTFAVLVAVLDTQFWLATHVVMISIGYGATLMAGFLGMAYVAQGLVTARLDKKRRRDFSNVIYGVICFGLVASFFGTVLGGLWADDSWGRFWGWDPKENGALMIVLWNAVALHARWGGMIRERGLAMLAIVGNLITLWSWKGVNAMGVGLHAYAGTEDATMKWILLFGFVSVLTLVVAMIPTKFWRSYSRA